MQLKWNSWASGELSAKDRMNIYKIVDHHGKGYRVQRRCIGRPEPPVHELEQIDQDLQTRTIPR